MPRRELFSVTCLDFTSANASIGDKPEFSAKARGVESRASAKARIALVLINSYYCSIEEISSAALATAREQVISANLLIQKEYQHLLHTQYVDHEQDYEQHK